MNTRISCPHCDFTTEIPAERIPRRARFATCPRCRERFPLHIGDEVPTPEPHGIAVSKGPPDDSDSLGEEHGKPGRAPSPWEDRDRIGLTRGIFRSFFQTLFSPGVFFRTMQTGRGLIEPLAIGILFGSAGMMLSLFNEFLPSVWGRGGGMQVLMKGSGSPLLPSTLMLLSPFIACVGIFFMSGVLHLFLRVFRGASGGFEGTLRVVAFGQATQVLALIPVIGGMIAFLWYLVVLIVGVREIHETSYGRVLLAFLSPALLLGAAALAAAIPFVLSLLNRLI